MVIPPIVRLPLDAAPMAPRAQIWPGWFCSVTTTLVVPPPPELAATVALQYVKPLPSVTVGDEMV